MDMVYESYVRNSITGCWRSLLGYSWRQRNFGGKVQILYMAVWVMIY
ncbi:hypothetical protein INT80_11320 [Gallibacterium anatis]|uniref:Uncharacterized protein n=1 Tax=Gallibacterium anatis TaxID=750 RepID=A0A930URY8_9PAST|nr:hypothetical protein [Gallibacterium anatis]